MSDTTQPREQADEDQFIIEAVERAKIHCVHPTAATTLDIGRAVLAAYRATQQAAPEAPTLTQRLNTPDQIDAYTRQLAMSLWRTHYRATSPEFKLLDDTYGVLSQVDNMLTGLVLAPIHDADGKLLAEMDWCISNGFSGIRTREALKAARAALTQQSAAQAPSQEAHEKLLTEIQAALDSLADTKMTTYTYTSMANVLHHCRDAITGKGYYGAAQAAHAGAMPEHMPDAVRTVIARFSRAVEGGQCVLFDALYSDIRAALAATEKKEQK